MKRATLCLALLILSFGHSGAGTVTENKVDATGWNVFELIQGDLAVRLVPEAGCNVYSIVAGDKELLRQPPSLKELPGFRYGNPVLYPTPNRVRDSVFKFGGREYKFTANERTNFLHGLVHDLPWKVVGKEQKDDYATVECAVEFEPGSKHYELFPHKHALKLAVTVKENAVRWQYTVDNSAGDSAVPFGFALHPWFLYQNARSKTFLTIPATHWMEAEGLLPTGKLVELKGSKFDARQPKSLGGFVIDDVYFGLQSDQPVKVEFREKQMGITLQSSPDFTHLVVYTPADQPWFCVENQTCSTDAHNLYAKGLKRESNLLVVEAGKTHTGWVEYQINR